MTSPRPVAGTGDSERHSCKQDEDNGLSDGTVNVLGIRESAGQECYVLYILETELSCLNVSRSMLGLDMSV